MSDSRFSAVDSHQHFWQLSRFTYPWMPPGDNPLRHDYLPQDLRLLLDATGIARSVAVQADNSVAEARWLLDLADEHLWIAGVVGWVDLTAPDVGETLAELRAQPKLVGVRHIVEDEPDDRWLLREDVLRGLGEVARHDLAYDLLLRPRHIACVRPIVERLPQLRLVVDHIAKPFIREGRREPWATEMADIARVPHLYCKVSGMVTEADHARWTWQDLRWYVGHVLEHFGEDRLMFGSDWPVCLLAAPYERVVEALRECLRSLGVSAAGEAKIFGANAARFYRLD
jgi:L-fuconolactonase